MITYKVGLAPNGDMALVSTGPLCGHSIPIAPSPCCASPKAKMRCYQPEGHDGVHLYVYEQEPAK